METSIAALAVTACSLGFFHTLLGPDHYLPFTMMATARGWSRPKTVWIVLLCGLGHVGSSVLLGLLGVALGVAVGKLESFEGTRGDLAAWAIIAFGLIYFIWGVRRAIRNKPHTHKHIHADGSVHDHEHQHHQEHSHVHEAGKKSVTPWALFVVFVLGPCEPLIPMLMYPAAKKSIAGMVLVAGVFSVVTIATMISAVLVTTFGVNLLPLGKLERYMHAIGGATICLCGCAIKFLGL